MKVVFNYLLPTFICLPNSIVSTQLFTFDFKTADKVWQTSTVIHVSVFSLQIKIKDQYAYTAFNCIIGSIICSVSNVLIDFLLTMPRSRFTAHDAVDGFIDFTDTKRLR
jgi:hypothetical protein